MMRSNKPLKDQVIVIMGASSGIGLATARMASERGAKVVLVARTDEARACRKLLDELQIGLDRSWFYALLTCESPKQNPSSWFCS